MLGRMLIRLGIQYRSHRATVHPGGVRPSSPFAADDLATRDRRLLDYGGWRGISHDDQVRALATAARELRH